MAVAHTGRRWKCRRRNSTGLSFSLGDTAFRFFSGHRESMSNVFLVGVSEGLQITKRIRKIATQMAAVRFVLELAWIIADPFRHAK